MSLSNKQVGVLAEKFFKSKPMGDVEQAKKDSRLAMNSFIKTYLGIEDPDGLSDKTVLEKMKMVARHANSPNANRVTNLGADVYRTAKDLFEGNKKEVDEVVTKITTTITQYQTDQNKDTEVPIEPGTKTVAVSGTQTPGKTTLTPMKEGEVTERFESKAQQGFFWAKCNTSKGVKKKKWCELAKEFSDETTKSDYEKMPKKKNSKKTDENYEKFLEERIMEMIEKHIEPTMTKRDFIRSIQEKKNNSENFMLENPKKNSMFAQNKGMEMKTMKRPIGKISSFEMKENTTEKEAPTTPGIKTPPKRKNPHKDPAPGIKENPKAENQKNDFMSAITSILNNA
jgi:hypothetical protein